MTQSKFVRLLNEFLQKLGDVEVIRLIDKYYRETYEGSTNWKVRKVVKLSDIIEAGVTPVTELFKHGFDGRVLLKYLEKYEKPIDISVKYEDSYARWKKQNEENADKEREKQRAFENATRLFNPYSMPFYHK